MLFHLFLLFSRPSKRLFISLHLFSYYVSEEADPARLSSLIGSNIQKIQRNGWCFFSLYWFNISVDEEKVSMYCTVRSILFS